jgi:hypothetical protein
MCPNNPRPYIMCPRWEGFKKKFDKLGTFQISAQVRNSLIFGIEPEHLNASDLHGKQFLQMDIWFEMNARPED